MHRLLVIALWMIAANLTWSNFREALLPKSALAQAPASGSGPSIARALSCGSHPGDYCVLRVSETADRRK
ncbi:MAG: hypothetical protein ABIT04_05835 [Novosphingobium sp.]